MGVIDWLVLLIWVVTGVEMGVEIKRKRWTAAGVSALFLAIFTILAWPRLVYLSQVVASWF